MGESLAGRADRLTGYSIALAVFDRDDTFDLQTDPVARLEARRLRRALEHYYLTAGCDEPIRIEISKGGHAPVFERQVTALRESSGAASAGTSRLPKSGLGPPSPAKFRGYPLLAIVFGATLAVAAGVAWFWLARAPRTQANLARMGGTFFFLSPALVAMCQAELGNQETARRALDEALTLDPTFAKDPPGAYHLHHVPEGLVEQFMAGLRKAGLEDPGA